MVPGSLDDVTSSTTQRDQARWPDRAGVTFSKIAAKSSVVVVCLYRLRSGTTVEVEEVAGLAMHGNLGNRLLLWFPVRAAESGRTRNTQPVKICKRPDFAGILDLGDLVWPFARALLAKREKINLV